MSFVSTLLRPLPPINTLYALLGHENRPVQLHTYCPDCESCDTFFCASCT